jgi:hypothetical protein
MVYPASFHKLVMIGDLFADTFNCTLSMVPTGGTAIPAVTDTLLANVAAAVGDWWDAPLATSPGNGLTLSGSARLTSIKLNRIGTDGRYVDPETKQHVYTSPIPGGGAAAGIPPQLTIVSTLRGNNERARAGKGRIYWPPQQIATSGLGTDGRLTIANAEQTAMGVRNLLGILNDIYLSAGVVAVAGIASKTGAGAFQGVNKVTVGRVVDTMRSRRNKDVEDPQEASM